MLDEFLLDKLAAQDDENEVMAALSLMPEDEATHEMWLREAGRE